MLFQHYSCSVDVEHSKLSLYGRTEEGSTVLYTTLKPILICGKDPRYVGTRRNNTYYSAVPPTAKIIYVKGNNIVEWGERTFYRVQFESVIDFFRCRKLLRSKGVALFNDQVGLDSQWFIEHDYTPCDCFEIEVNPCRGKQTHCDKEYWLKSMTPAQGYIEPTVLSYDIECLLRPGHFPDPFCDPIITIGCYSKKESKCFCLEETPGFDSFTTEKELIKRSSDTCRQSARTFSPGTISTDSTTPTWRRDASDWGSISNGRASKSTCLRSSTLRHTRIRRAHRNNTVWTCPE